METFFKYLQGRFDSTAQAAKDKTYFEIQVEICEATAPGLGERVLYIEQARMDALSKPYRQRLYVIEAGADPSKDAVSRVFEFKTASKWVGYCGQETRPTFTEADADEKVGCAVVMAWDGLRFQGGTQGKGCESALNGATYATSEVILRADGFSSWDRGYDASDAQVWGAVKGPYEFDRKTPLP